jgi:hypothetical protein
LFLFYLDIIVFMFFVRTLFVTKSDKGPSSESDSKKVAFAKHAGEPERTPPANLPLIDRSTDRPSVWEC